jgi:hypothetical protein
MIFSRRKAHFFSFIALACLLPLVFLVGVFFRPTFIPADPSTAPLFALAGFPDAQTLALGETIGSNSLQAQGFQWQAETFQSPVGGKVLLKISPSATIRLPDPLLYWQAGSQAPTEITSEAILLGGLSGKSDRLFTLPAQAQGGQLILYSLGFQKIAASFPLPESLTDRP